MFLHMRIYFSLATYFRLMEIIAEKTKTIINQFPNGIHGIEHSFRVYELIQKLCDLERVTGLERLELGFCAFFHDIGRINDNVDITHGYKSFEKLKRLNFFGLTSFNNPIVKYIIENHCINDYDALQNSKNYSLTNPKRAKYLLLLFKDADGLDRFRLGDFNKKYLRNTSTYGLIDLARLLNEEKITYNMLSTSIQTWYNQNFIDTWRC